MHVGILDWDTVVHYDIEKEKNRVETQESFKLSSISALFYSS